MNHFTALQNFIHEKFTMSKRAIHLHGIEESQWPFIQGQMDVFRKAPSQVFIFDSQEKAEHYYDSMHDKLPGRVLLYPGIDASLYQGHIHSDFSLLKRFEALASLSSQELNGPSQQKITLCTSLDAATLFVPLSDFFNGQQIRLSITDIIAPQDLAKRLVNLGLRPTISMEERGTFCQKGEIFDIYPLNGPPLRIYYFDDMIEEIFAIDPTTQKTVRQRPYEQITLSPVPGIFGSAQFTTTFRRHITRFGPSQKNKELNREDILNKLGEGLLFESYAIYCPLFLKEKGTLFDYLNPRTDLIHFFNIEQSERSLLSLIEELKEENDRISKDRNNPCILPGPEQFYSSKFKKLWEDFKTIHIDHFLTPIELLSHEEQDNHLHSSLEPAMNYLKMAFPEFFKEQISLTSILCSLVKCSEENKKIIIVFTHESSKKEIQNLLEVMGKTCYIEFHFGFLEKGFHYLQENLLVLSEADFLRTTKKKKTPSKRPPSNIDLFAEQISSLNIDDYIIHQDYGIGIYKGLETLNIGGNRNDFLVLHYQGQDKVYVPVYKIGLVQKYANSSTNTKVACLKSNKFNQAKKRARESVKKLAFDLLKIQAEREHHQSYCFSPPGDLFQEFEQKFPFRETPDQASAIEDVLADMQKSRPMDRIVCGDVGFGKTEVAMRASFKAVEDGMQVVIMVPTTILALQHYHSFQKRFQDLAVKIDFLSRLKSTNEINETIEKIKLGQIDILIGTHKILSSKIVFKNLGLLVIDEEHRFGVAHKEKLKAMKTSVDVLTLTATPIPRTLQLAFLGIRDLSLIQMAPPKRQSIKTYIIKQDDETIRKAINSELQRGGQIFFVHNRVKDIPRIAEYLRELVPSIKMITIHGQMPEKEIEKKMSNFYNYQYDLLLSTTIIESGLDIPSANTMIINRAEIYGLAQLHQLRGRIGRSERKAYAYFLIPNDRKISAHAAQRLQALQSYAEIGSGFALASSDLEIRGSGDILGAEQSGHIEAIGLETYMELLKEAINELQGNQQELPPKDMEIQTPFSCFIPNFYISDPKERLRTYKRLANITKAESLESIQVELQDRFGIIPMELEQLFQLMSIRLILRPLGIEKIKVTGKTIELKFSEQFIDNRVEYRDKIVNFFLSQPRKYRFDKYYSVTRTFPSSIAIDKLSQFAQSIAHQLFLC